MAIENLSELEHWQPPNRGNSIISDGILDPGTAMLLFGPPKSWKSMASLNLGFSIASGLPWFGYQTTQSVVLIFQAELPKAVFKKRVMKFRAHFPTTKLTPESELTLPTNKSSGLDANSSIASTPNSALPNLLFETNNYCKLDTTYGKDVLNSCLLQCKSRFPNWHITIILDPVYLLMSGKVSEEYDVRRMLDNLNELRNRHDLSIILIHHSHKTRVTTEGEVIDTGSDEIFGSGYFNFWCDTEVRLKRMNPFGLDNRIEHSFTLTRNAEQVLMPFEVEWSRATLQPTLVFTKPPATQSEDDITSRGLSTQ
jgi:RecA-family ATPase